MLKRNNPLIANRGIAAPQNINCDSIEITNDYNAFITELLPAQAGLPVTQRMLPVNPPFELHPYLATVNREYFEKYIIGTFPPISYVIDQLNNHPAVAAAVTSVIPPAGGNAIIQPHIDWFHGNVAAMWPFLLAEAELGILNGLPREDKRAWLINFLNQQRIIYSDIIKSAQREQYNANDQGLFNICINNDLICHILKNPNSQYLLFNTGSTFGNNGISIHLNANANGLPGEVNINQNTKSFDLFIRGCQQLKLKVEFGLFQGPTPPIEWTEINAANANFIMDNFHNKIIFQVRISVKQNTDRPFLSNCLGADHHFQKTITVITGPSPSPLALIGIAGNNNFLNWQLLNPGGTTNEFIKYIHVCFRNNMWAALYALNL